MPEISDPSPPIPPKLPVNALAIPPDAVCFSKLVHSLPELEAFWLEEEGLPNLIPSGVTFPPIEARRVSPKRGRVGFFSVSDALACPTRLVGENNKPLFSPPLFVRDNSLKIPDKLFFDFPTLLLHLNGLVKNHERLGRLSIHGQNVCSSELLPHLELLDKIQALCRNH